MECTRYVYGICYDGEIIYTGSTNNMKIRWNGYKSDHLNPECSNYKMKICKFMREKDFANFSHVIIETVPEITEKDILQYEGMWQDTLTELGFDLLNDRGAGNGSANEWGSISYYNNQAWKLEKIPCELCGKLVCRNYMNDHQRRSNCI